jgi:hypothetical protein
LVILNRNTVEEADGSLAASLAEFNRFVVFIFMQLGAFEQLTRSFLYFQRFSRILSRSSCSTRQGKQWYIRYGTVK